MHTSINRNPISFDHLNDQQREAVTYGDGPLLVLAGAGTGKTRVLIHRLVYLIQEKNISSHQIMAVTFTNKAAKEMRQRLEALLQTGGMESMMIGTFHSLSARILRRHAEFVKLTPRFTIIDTDDQIRLIKKIMKELEIDDKATPPRYIANKIESWKGKVLLPTSVSAKDMYNDSGQSSLLVYKQYQKQLVNLNAVDFSDLLMYVILIFRDNPSILEYWQNRLKYVLVDEYQDTNHAQETILKLLTAVNNNIFCVGDEDQSIYSWRGADIRNILNFKALHAESHIIKLEHNYRSTSNILHAASTLISHNTERLGKTLYTPSNNSDNNAETNSPDLPVRLFVAIDSTDEASRIIQEALYWQNSGKDLRNIAILVRISAQTRVLEDQCLKATLPYIIYGGLRFYEREEIRDCIAYLRLVHQSRDDLAFTRIINKPTRGIGLSAISTISMVARNKDLSMLEATKYLVKTDELRPQAKNSCLEFLNLYDNWQNLALSISHVELLQRILDETSYSAMIKKKDKIHAEAKLDNVKELLLAMGELPDLTSFLEHASLVIEHHTSQTSGCITIMTIHSAKGLEFSRVYLPGWEDGLIPHERALMEGGNNSLEEERRLAYVAITRARHEVIFSRAHRRMLHGTWRVCFPSRFLDELPQDKFEIELLSANSQENTRFTNYYDNAPVANFVISTRGNTTSPLIKVGTRCSHQKFGIGRVVHITSDDLVTVDFSFGRKTTIGTYLKPVLNSED